MTNHVSGGGVPLLGAEKMKATLGAQGHMVRASDAQFQFDPEAIVMGPEGQPVAKISRNSFVDATELADLIQGPLLLALASLEAKVNLLLDERAAKARARR